ncbi:hypothetical protein MMC21_002159 [Puttea exsequens]|nr:hypothetical protein [Puttea exsequens]
MLKPRSLQDDVHYTVLIRLPFPRGDFVDPPAVDWDSSKDRELWDFLSKAQSKGRELDSEIWHGIANRFNVTPEFLTQQAAWLYEKELAQVRAQLRKVNRPLSGGTPPTPGSVTGSTIVGGHAMTRAGSGGSRVPSSLAHQPLERTVSYSDGSKEMQRPVRGTLSRTTSTNTVKQFDTTSPNASPRTSREKRPSFARRRSFEASPKKTKDSAETSASPSAIVSDSSSSSSSSDADALHPMNRSRMFARRPRHSSGKRLLKPLSDADEEEDDDVPFLPFSNAKPSTPPPVTDQGATVKISPKHNIAHHKNALGDHTGMDSLKPRNPRLPRTAHSSSSSAQSQSRSQNRPPQNPLSALSPKQRRAAKEGSEGTPSMGSSFSDLDDSVTQSALEEALANEMQHGGVASRMSTISQALRSRYL